jgi:hypothetical protein
VVTYTVHEPPNGPANHLQSAEELVFVKDGFSWFAALIPAVWLLWKRMWLEFFIFIAAAGLIAWAFSAAEASDAGNAILLAIQIVFGFEAGALYSAALERRGWRVVGTVSGRSQEDCERRFLEVWLPTHTEIPASPPLTASPDTSTSWSQTALTQAKDAVARGRRALARA